MPEEEQVPPPQAGQVLPKRGDSPDVRTPEIVGAIIAGFLGNLILRTGAVASASSALLVIVLVVTLIWSSRVRRREPLLFLALASAVAPWLAIRADTPLTLANVVTVLILLGVAAGISLRGSPLDVRVRDVVMDVWAPTFEWLYGLGLLRRFATALTTDRKLAPFLRGIAVAIPVLIVFTTLLASADDVFAKFLLLGNLPTLVGHIIVTLLVAIVLFGFVSRAAHETPPAQKSLNIRMLGSLEVTIILGSLAALFSAFVITQLVVAFGGADHVLRTEGLTSAEHARSGFFQLLWVAGLAVSLVGGLRAVRITNPEKGRDRFTPLALVTLLLTVVIAGISLQRLLLYVGSFGLTPLRFWAIAGAGGVAVLIATYALSVAGWQADRSWFPGTAIVLSALFVFGLNVVNPDAQVASYNISRATTTVDVETLQSLSDDAVEELIRSEPNLPDVAGTELLDQLCLRPDRETSFGLFEYNAGRVGADRALDTLCTEREAGGNIRGRD
ncbi:MAG: hypothetical protein ACI81L_000492 [Verrucomicrobiales bacterium]|jgi:hypothetical protein